MTHVQSESKKNDVGRQGSSAVSTSTDNARTHALEIGHPVAAGSKLGAAFLNGRKSGMRWRSMRHLDEQCAIGPWKRQCAE